MPLIEKGILIEGDDGKAIERKYYVREKPVNPYGDRQEMARRKGAQARRTINRRCVPHEKGYLWTMGYNHCAGTYSPGGKYPKWNGSSLNRCKYLRHDIISNALPEEREAGPDVPGRERDLLKVAFARAGQYYKRALPVPRELLDYLSEQNKETARVLRRWLSSPQDRPDDGFSLPVYVLSPRSRGKIKDKATAFFRACPGERIFVTLTFIAPVADGTAVALLNKFLVMLRKEFARLQYLWVAERQENGNIHFHMILNKRFTRSQLRKYNALWVLQQYRAGLEGKTLFGVPVSRAQVEEMYRSGAIGKTFPFNPLDAKRVRSIAGLSSYLTKYITKQSKTFFACQPWHCSRGVSRLFTRAVVSPSAFRYMTGIENCRIDKETGEVFLPQPARPKGRGAAYCIIVYVNRKEAPLKYLREMEQVNKWLIKGIQMSGTIDVLDDDLNRKMFCQN